MCLFSLSSISGSWRHEPLQWRYTMVLGGISFNVMSCTTISNSVYRNYSTLSAWTFFLVHHRQCISRELLLPPYCRKTGRHKRAWVPWSRLSRACWGRPNIDCDVFTLPYLPGQSYRLLSSHPRFSACLMKAGCISVNSWFSPPMAVSRFSLDDFIPCITFRWFRACTVSASAAAWNTFA